MKKDRGFGKSPLPLGNSGRSQQASRTGVSGVRKAVSSGGDFKRFQEFFDYIEPFQSKCFLVAEEESRFVGFAVGIHNPEWVNDLTERYGRGIEKRAHILGIAFTENRKGILKALTKELTKYFSGMGIRSVEYPTFGKRLLDYWDRCLDFRERGCIDSVQRGGLQDQ